MNHLFFYACIPTRILFAVLVRYLHSYYLPFVAFICLAIAVGFLVIYVFKLRDTGIETGGKPIWWNHIRPVHAGLYLLVSYHLFNGDARSASNVLMLDVLFGALSSLIFYNYIRKVQ